MLKNKGLTFFLPHRTINVRFLSKENFMKDCLYIRVMNISQYYYQLFEVCSFSFVILNDFLLFYMSVNKNIKRQLIIYQLRVRKHSLIFTIAMCVHY